MKIRALLSTVLATAAVFSLSVFSPVHAENPATCPGEITGKTDPTSDANAGILDFDGEDGSADLTIVGGGVGFAPADSFDAACVSELGGDTYQINEYVWNTNAGFIRFSGCGGNNCEVIIESDDDADGVRDVSGQAWNELFGYIYFDNVTLEEVAGGWAFAADSWAYTDTGVWINFYGDEVLVTLSNEDEDEPDDPFGPGEDYCDPLVEDCRCKDEPFICLDVRDPDDDVDIENNPSFGFGFGFGENIAIADGVSGYDIVVSIKDENGDPLSDSDEFDLDSFQMTFDWTDTVKQDQTWGKTGNFSNQESSVNGAVVYKPINISFSDLDPIRPGVYVLKQGKIRSIAPTSDVNISQLSGVSDPGSYLVNNETFIAPLSESAGGPIWTDDIESNELVLENMTFELKDINGDPAVDSGGKIVENTVIYPKNGNKAMSMPFRPAVEVHELYADNNQDAIAAYKNIPFWLTAEARELGNADFSADPNVEFNINYSIQETIQDCTQGANFDIYFREEGGKKKSFSLGELSGSQIFSASADLPGETIGLPCTYAQGPTVYSVVNYGITAELPSGQDKTFTDVRYYHNKVPRVGGDGVSNTQIYVSGLVKGNAAFNTALDTKPVTTSGDVNVSIVRSTIHENIVKQSGVSNQDIEPDGGVCEVTALTSSGANLSNCGGEGFSFLEFAVGDEMILYSKDDISINLTSGTWSGRWVVVSDGGHVSIDSDVYREDFDGKSHVAIVAFRGEGSEIGESGNVYVHPDVKNIQATTIADGSMLSCFADEGQSCLAEDLKENGIPEGQIGDLVANLQNQLLYQGNIATKNTIGGFNYNSQYTFRMRASGEIVEPEDETPELLYETMMEDLNFLRMFRLEVQVSDSGLPIDQKCKMPLTPEMQKMINEGEQVVNEDTGVVCDGIDSLHQWTPNCEAGTISFLDKCGDLYVDQLDTRRAQGVFDSGLSVTEASLPVLVIYTKIPDSVIFSKQGAVRY